MSKLFLQIVPSISFTGLPAAAPIVFFGAVISALLGYSVALPEKRGAVVILAMVLLGLAALASLQRKISSAYSIEERSLFIIIIFGLLGVVFFEPAPFELLLVIGFPAALLTGKLSRAGLVLSPSLLVLCLLIAVAQGVTIFRTTQPLGSAFYWLITLLMLFIAVASSYLGQSKSFLKSLLFGYVLGAAVTTVLTLLAYFQPLPYSNLVTLAGLRLQGFFKDPNVYAPYMFLPALLFLNALVSKTSPVRLGSKWVQMAGFGLTSLAIFLAFSRAAWGGYAVSIVALIFIVALKNPRVVFRVSSMGMIAILTAVMTWNLLPPEQLQYFDARNQLQEYDSLRFETQKLSWELAGEYPFLGHGPLAAVLNLGLGTHNLYLQMLYEHGLIGFALGFGILCFATVTSLKYSIANGPEFVRSWSGVLFSCLVGQLATSLFIDSTHWRHLWVLVGLAWALPYLAQRTAPGRGQGFRECVAKSLTKP